MFLSLFRFTMKIYSRNTGFRSLILLLLVGICLASERRVFKLSSVTSVYNLEQSRSHRTKAELALESLSYGEQERIVSISPVSCEETTRKGKKLQCSSTKSSMVFHISSLGLMDTVLSKKDLQESQLLSTAIHLLQFPSNPSMVPFGHCSTVAQDSSGNEGVRMDISDCTPWPQSTAYSKGIEATQDYRLSRKWTLGGAMSVRGCDATETYSISLPIYSKSSLSVQSNHSVRLQSESNRLEDLAACSALKTATECLASLKKSGYQSVSNIWSEYATTGAKMQGRQRNVEPAFAELFKNFTRAVKKFTDLPQPAMAKSYLRLLRHLKTHPESFTDLQKEVAKARDVKIISSLADLFANLNTLEAHRMAMETIFSAKPDLMEKYLVSLSNSEASPEIIDDFIDSIDLKVSEEIPKQMEARLMTAAALIKNLRRKKRTDPKKDAQITETFLEKIFKLWESKIEDSKKLYLRVLEALENPSTVTILIKEFEAQESGSPEILSATLKTLASFWNEGMDPSIKSAVTEYLLKIYRNAYRVKVTPTSRALAADLLVDLLRNENGLSEQNRAKITRALVSQFHNASSNAERELFSYVHAKLPKAQMKYGVRSRNYNDQAWGGFSGAHNGILGDAGKNGGVVYDLEMEFASSVLKRSSFNFFWEKQDRRSPILSFSLFSQGLESFLAEEGEEEKGEEEEAPASAGMQMGFFGTLQRPLTFFSGQSELMSAVWGADGSPLTGYEGNQLLHDYSLRIPLLNGQSFAVDLQSALTLKLFGSIEVSIWNRNSQSVVTTAGSLFSDASGILVSSGGKRLDSAKMELWGAGKIDFTTDVDFYDKIRMCMKMEHLDLNMGQLVRHAGKKMQRKRRIPGRTFVLHPKASQLCTDYANDSGS